MKKYKSVSEFLESQEKDKLEEINRLREIILSTEPTLIETLKWNAPSYVYKGEDRITFNVMNKQNKVQIIIHMGALKKEDKKGPCILQDDKGIVNWSSDIRGIIKFDGISEINSKERLIRDVISTWLNL